MKITWGPSDIWVGRRVFGDTTAENSEKIIVYMRKDRRNVYGITCLSDGLTSMFDDQEELANFMTEANIQPVKRIK